MDCHSGLWAEPYYNVMKNSRIKLSRKAAILRNSRKCSPKKVSGYTANLRTYVRVYTCTSSLYFTVIGRKLHVVTLSPHTPHNIVHAEIYR